MKKTKFQFLMWAIALVIGFTSCGSDEENKPIIPDVPSEVDPYLPITEGKIFLPVLTNKPDMDKVRKAEATRKGTLVNKNTLTTPTGAKEDRYLFNYEGMDIIDVQYVVNAETGKLLRVEISTSKDEKILSKYEALIKKNKFNDKHPLTDILGHSVRDEKELFSFNSFNGESNNLMIFTQYGKQPKAMTTVSSMNGQWDNVFKSLLPKYADVKNKEEKTYKSTLELTNKITEGVHKDEVAEALFRTDDKELPLIYRSFSFLWEEFFSEDLLGTCKRVSYLYNNPSVGFYDDDIQNMKIPTKEFLEKIKTEGYVISTYTSNGTIVCYNNKKKLECSTQVRPFHDIAEGRTILVLNFNRMPE